MTTKSDFTAEEWEQVIRLPGMVGAFIITSSISGPIQVMKEMLAIGTTIAETSSTGADSGLVDALIADVKSGSHPDPTDSKLEYKNNEEARAAILDYCRATMSLVRSKASGAEAQNFKAWLLSIGNKVAEAGKEGGFLGFGGTLVSNEESTALTELDAALGV